MYPATQHIRPCRGQESIVHQRPDDVRPEQSGGTTGRTSAEERQELLELAVVAANASKAAVQVAPFEEYVHDLRDDGVAGSRTGTVLFLVKFKRRVEMRGNALPQ